MGHKKRSHSGSWQSIKGGGWIQGRAGFYTAFLLGAGVCYNCRKLFHSISIPVCLCVCERETPKCLPSRFYCSGCSQGCVARLGETQPLCLSPTQLILHQTGGFGGCIYIYFETRFDVITCLYNILIAIIGMKMWISPHRDVGCVLSLLLWQNIGALNMQKFVFIFMWSRPHPQTQSANNTAALDSLRYNLSLSHLSLSCGVWR